MKLTQTLKRKNENITTYRYRQIDENSGECVSSALICLRDSQYAGRYIPTLTVADVFTKEEYRNRGLVRQMIEAAHINARDLGAYVSLLHPFSFSFYRKFGYERISDTVKVEFPLAALNCIEEYKELQLLDESSYGDLLTLFEKFIHGRNLCFKRPNIAQFLRKRSNNYLYYNGKNLEGYIAIELDNRTLTVKELAFLDREALVSLLAFLKKWKDDADKVVICDIGPVPEVDYILKNYSDTVYTVIPDLCARVLDTEKMLLANEYPKEYGIFTLKVNDVLESVRGVFKVEYANKICSVERLDSSAIADLELDARALTRLLYGYDSYTSETLSYMDNVKIHGDIYDLLRAFPKRTTCGLFEHF